MPLGEDDGRDRFWALGRKLTGFAFGQRGAAVYCRVYDKTTEIRRRGLSWLPDLWGDREADAPVWRVEFELRRPVLVQHGLRAVDEVLAGVQDLWRYCTRTWLTYRAPVGDARERRWPVDPVWEQVQAIRLASNELGVVRGRVDQATEEQLVMGATGYLSSLAAFHGWSGGVTGAMERVGPILVRYLESRGRTREALVARKAAQRMSVTGWADELAESEEEVA